MVFYFLDFDPRQSTKIFDIYLFRWNFKYKIEIKPFEKRQGNQNLFIKVWKLWLCKNHINKDQGLDVRLIS